MTDIALEFRRQLVTACAKATDKPCVLLSGGLDSGSILAAMLETGIPFSIAAMRFGGFPGEDDLAAHARWQAMCPHVPFELVTIPRNVVQAHDTALWVIENSGSVLKTAIEVSVVMKPFVEHLIGQGHKTLLNGMSGGLLWGVGRHVMMGLVKDGVASWQEQKRRWMKYEFEGFPPNASRVMRWHTGQLGGLWYDPLAELTPLMSSATYEQLNKPRPKAMACRAFPALAETPVKAGGLQVVAGVREFMDQVVAVEHLGINGTATRYYSHLAHQLGIKARGSDQAKETWSRR